MIKATYQVNEQGSVNAKGDFVQSFARWEKRYLMELLVPEFVLDALVYATAHDNVTLYDPDPVNIFNITVDYEWKECFADVKLSFSVEELTRSKCCDSAGEPDIIDVDGPEVSFLFPYIRWQDVSLDSNLGSWQYTLALYPASGEFTNFGGVATWDAPVWVNLYSLEGGSHYQDLQSPYDAYLVIIGLDDAGSYVIYGYANYYLLTPPIIKFYQSGYSSIIEQGTAPVVNNRYFVFVSPLPVENSNLLVFTKYDSLDITKRYNGDVYHYQDGQFTCLNLAKAGNIIESNDVWYQYSGLWWQVVPSIENWENTSGDDWVFRGNAVKNSFVQGYQSFDDSTWVPIGDPVTDTVFATTGLPITFPVCCDNFFKVLCYNHSKEFKYSATVRCIS